MKFLVIVLGLGISFSLYLLFNRAYYLLKGIVDRFEEKKVQYETEHPQPKPSYSSSSPRQQAPQPQAQQQPKLPECFKKLGFSEWPKTKDEVKKNFRELAKQHHPDKGGDAVKFEELNQAYQEASLLVGDSNG